MEVKNSIDYEAIMAKALELPVVRVNRSTFLADCFKNEDVDMALILDVGPVAANCPRDMLRKLADNLILRRTGESSIMSFVAGMPGGITLGVTIPADTLQYFISALRLAQGLAYIYGAEDFWADGYDTEIAKAQLMLYCGVMFEADNAESGVRLISSIIADSTAKALPPKALTGEFWYPLIKQIGKAVGAKVAKGTVASGAAKVLPVFGGVVCGGITYASMLPMGKRLAAVLDEAIFEYSADAFDEDIACIESFNADDMPETGEEKPKVREFIDDKLDDIRYCFEQFKDGMRTYGHLIDDTQDYVLRRMDEMNGYDEEDEAPAYEDDGDLEDYEGEEFTPNFTLDYEDVDVFDTLRKVNELYKDGILTEEEYAEKKAELLKKI